MIAAAAMLSASSVRQRIAGAVKSLVVANLSAILGVGRGAV